MSPVSERLWARRAEWRDDRAARRVAEAKAGLITAAEVLDLVERVATPRHLTAQVQFFIEATMDPAE